MLVGVEPVLQVGDLREDYAVLPEKENEFLGKVSAFFTSGHHNTSGLN